MAFLHRTTSLFYNDLAQAIYGSSQHLAKKQLLLINCAVEALVLSYCAECNLKEKVAIFVWDKLK